MNSTSVNKSSILSLAFVFLLSISFSSCGQVSASSSSSSIKDAREAYEQMEHAKAYSIFKQIWEDKNQILADRTLAGQRLAKMDWILYGKHKRAYDMLSQLEKRGHERSTAYVLRSRVLADESKFDEAIAIADKAVEAASSETEKYNARMAYSSHVLSKVSAELLKDPKRFMAESIEIGKAHEILSVILRENPRDTEAAEMHLASSLLSKKGTEAFKAWMLFFHQADIDQIHPTLMKAPESFKTALGNYASDSSEEVVQTIIKGLAESGFYQHAVLLKAKEFGLKPHADSEINDIVVYQHFLSTVEEITFKFYRETTAGNVAIYDYTREYKEASKELWSQLHRKGQLPAFSDNAFDRTLRERFKTLINFMTVANHYGLHMGHVVLDDRRMINQYGQSAEFRYKVVDHMVSNGYGAWFSDGASQVGGWATDDESFLQIRSGLGPEMTRIWSLLNDPVEVKKVLDDIDRYTSMEDAMAEENPYAFLPSLKLRLVYYESKAVLDSIKSTGLDNSELRVAFINLMENIALDSKIYAHEGRHSIDMKRNYSNSSKELEFTAKLSEIYFSAKPKLFLGTIINPNMGDGTSHGEGNLKLVKGLVKWAEKHKKEIAGFDNNRPTLPQLDKLTNEQLREAVRSMDPMAN